MIGICFPTQRKENIYPNTLAFKSCCVSKRENIKLYLLHDTNTRDISRNFKTESNMGYKSHALSQRGTWDTNHMLWEATCSFGALTDCLFSVQKNEGHTSLDVVLLNDKNKFTSVKRKKINLILIKTIVIKLCIIVQS